MYEIALRDPFHRDPFNDVRRLMRRQFDVGFLGGQPTGQPSGLLSRRPRDRFSERRAWRPALPVDVSETEDGLTIEAGLPGFASDEVTVGIEGRTLTIRAAHDRAAQETVADGAPDSTDASADAESTADDVVESTTTPSETYVLQERSTQGLERSLRIGRAYDPDTVAASLKDGLLTVTIGKTLAAQSRTVEISVS
jgi:HSP20 family molecular chaperone IbpA